MDMKKKAKMDALMALKDEMQKMMADSSGLKKVTVASPDKEGLEHGLEKAQEMLGGEESEESEEEMCPECMTKHAPGEHVSSEESEEEQEEAEMSPEEIRSEIERLQSLLKEKEQK